MKCVSASQVFVYLFIYYYFSQYHPKKTELWNNFENEALGRKDISFTFTSLIPT
jgi:hypothetical protein